MGCPASGRGWGRTTRAVALAVAGARGQHLARMVPRQDPRPKARPQPVRQLGWLAKLASAGGVAKEAARPGEVRRGCHLRQQALRQSPAGVHLHLALRRTKDQRPRPQPPLHRRPAAQALAEPRVPLRAIWLKFDSFFHDFCRHALFMTATGYCLFTANSQYCGKSEL